MLISFLAIAALIDAIELDTVPVIHSQEHKYYTYAYHSNSAGSHQGLDCKPALGGAIDTDMQMHSRLIIHSKSAMVKNAVSEQIILHELSCQGCFYSTETHTNIQSDTHTHTQTGSLVGRTLPFRYPEKFRLHDVVGAYCGF